LSKCKTDGSHFFGTLDTSQGNDLNITAAHGDWSGLVTGANPARAGEIIHVYLNGLGPVSPAVPTGTAGPAKAPSRVIETLVCQFWNGTPLDAMVYFAGLAPGMVGVYQVSLQVPNGLHPSLPTQVTCGFGSALGSAIGRLPIF
jgi:uncharacterized protein (TIGR03437 family)